MKTHSLIIAIIALCPCFTASAFEPSITKLVATNKLPQVSPQFGYSVAMNDKWIVIGEWNNDDLVEDSGAVHVFSTTTGLEVKKLLASDASMHGYFGYAVAVAGDVAVVSAIGGNGFRGTAYLFNLTTGAEKKLVPTDVLDAGVGFGYSVAIVGNRVVVGARSRVEAGIASGVAYVFDLATGAQLMKLIPGDGASNDFFGASVAGAGNVAWIGSPYADGANANEGAVYAYDLTTGAQLWKLHATVTAADEHFGKSLALSGQQVFVGTYHQAGNGSVYSFNLATGTQLRKFTASDPQINSNFGFSIAANRNLLLVGSNTGAYVFDSAMGTQLQKLVNDGFISSSYTTSAMSGNNLLIGAYADAPFGPFSGSAYLYRNVASPLPMSVVADKSSYVADTPKTTFSAFTESVVNWQGESLYSATLTGPGTAGGKTRGVWSTLNGSSDLLLRLGDTISVGVKVADLSQPLLNHGNLGVFRAKLSGTGITSVNDGAIYTDDGMALTQLSHEGVNAYGTLASFTTVVQNANIFVPGIIVGTQYTIGKGGVTATSDTRIEVYNQSAALISHIEEGRLVINGGTEHFGQFSGRVAYTGTDYAWACALPEQPAATNAAVFKATASDANATATVIALKGTLANNVTGVFSAFLGESISLNNSILIHATMSGAGITATNNEGLWSTRGGGTLQPVALEGTNAQLGVGIVFNSFPKFWATGGFIDQVAFLAKLRGPGVSAANDQALYLIEENGIMLPLMREGDAAPGCNDGAKIGSILAVEFEPFNGVYVVLTSLSGGTAGKDLALFSGSSTTANATTKRTLRLPTLRLRKGTAYQATLGTTSKLKTIALPATSTDNTGAGGKGIGQCLTKDGGMLLRLTFDDGSMLLANGTL